MKKIQEDIPSFIRLFVISRRRFRPTPVVLSLEKTISIPPIMPRLFVRKPILVLLLSFCGHKAERLPSLTLNITPAEYYRYHETIRFSSTLTNYCSTPVLLCGGNLKIKQNLICCGSFVDTDSGVYAPFRLEYL